MRKNTVTLFIDGGAGVTGDRLLAALVDAGVPVRWLNRLLARGPRPSATGPRLAREVIASVAHARLPAAIKRTALTILRRLIWAEARAHRCPVRDVVLHQVSRPEALATIIGVSAGLTYLGVRRVIVSPLRLGARYQDHAGRWRRAVGPAVRQLTRGWPVRVSRRPVEFTTPTGAAIITALAPPPVCPAGWWGSTGRPFGPRTGGGVVARGCGWSWPVRRALGAIRVVLVR